MRTKLLIRVMLIATAHAPPVAAASSPTQSTRMPASLAGFALVALALVRFSAALASFNRVSTPRVSGPEACRKCARP